jgi:beta-glucanase (GH16 family)
VLPIGANTVRGSAHAPGYSGADSIHGDATVSNLTGQFHVYAIEWEPTEIRWYVDGRKYFTITPKAVHGKWAFDRPFFIILNLAIGGNWPGAPDNSTRFPVQMLVDYVRVYQKGDAANPAGAAPRAGTVP